MTLCRALMDGGEAAGLIVLELDARMFGSLVLTKQKILNYQTTFLTDRSGTVLYSDSAIHDSWLRPALEPLPRWRAEIHTYRRRCALLCLLAV